jgi:Spy/CpxP family protein refolding chaperone
MKINKLGMMATLALGGSLAFGSAASAQTPSTSTNAPGSEPAARHVGMQSRLKKIEDELKLTDDQKEKWKTIFQERAQKMRDLHQDTSLSGPDRTAKMKEIQEATDTKVKAILTPEQQAEWEKLRHGRRGGPQAATPKPADTTEQK